MINKSSGRHRGSAATDSHQNPSGIIILILIILILIFIFFWRFIDSQSVKLIGTIKSGFPSPEIISGASITGNKPTTTEYNSEYLRWAGQVKAGQTAVWGGITIKPSGNEIPVGNQIDPGPPGIIYGNVRETTGNGINFLILDEANYNLWKKGKKDIISQTAKNNVYDTDYTLNISRGKYYIVFDNKENSEDAFVGFTGVMASVRQMTEEEAPSEKHQYPVFKWEIKNEKLTLFEYILKHFKPDNNIPQTPPSIN